LSVRSKQKPGGFEEPYQSIIRRQIGKSKIRKMKPQTPLLRVGDPAPWFRLPTQNKADFFLRSNAGKPIILFFYAQDEIPACQEIACRFRDLMPIFNQSDVRVFSISSNLPESRLKFSQDHHLPFTLLSDSNLAVSIKYGVCSLDENDPSSVSYHRTAFLLDSNLRILKIYPLANLEEAINKLLADIPVLIRREELRAIQMQAPVLLIPNVLDLKFCRYLIEIWETRGNSESGFMKQDGEKTVGYLDPSHKLRRDHFIEDKSLINHIDSLMQRRVFPEIKQAFQFEVNRRESYKIACYDAKDGGYFRPHRDNTTPGTAHRRFAMTINLNVEEYEGGFLRFSEHSPHLYKPDTGSAIIFSCSLMHEATDVTAGRRFALLAFFYNTQDAESRQKYEDRVQNNYEQVIRVQP
jgi:peroxiredoxin/predicted 2-oxoglutarate/Fe(II)-dependent dioxygenase YbiX